MTISAEDLAALIREIEVEDPIDYGDLPYDEDDLRLLVCNQIHEISDQAGELGEENRTTVLLAVAIVWPLATQTLTWLSVLACLGATVLLGCACILHTRRGETELAGLTGLLGVLAAVVTLGIAF